MLSPAQIADYERDGFVILRNTFDIGELDRLDAAFSRNPPLNATMGDLEYPAPGRYTLAHSALKDPDFAFIVEHPQVVEPARTLLDDDVFLTAFVLYDRTPGGAPIPAHNDYKRWRPVGSSMNWLFTIIPMTDFNAETGQLFVYPGSHHLDRIKDNGERALHVDPAISPDPDGFIDPLLKRGDLLIMNMHTWHKAAGNRSDLHRVGLFNKYAAKQYPPATGYYLFDDEAFEALSPQNRDLIAVHSNREIGTTRLLLERTFRDERQFLMCAENGKLTFPGGPVHVEQAIPDWDIGNYIDACKSHIRDQLRLEPPWISYVGDYEEGEQLSRIYAYPMNTNGFPVPDKGAFWMTIPEIKASADGFGYEAAAVADWLDDSKVRGKGLTQAQSRLDQYAY